MSSTSQRVGLSTPIYLAICTRTCSNSPRSRKPFPSISTLLNASSINFFILFASFISDSNFFPAILILSKYKLQYLISQISQISSINLINIKSSMRICFIQRVHAILQYYLKYRFRQQREEDSRVTRECLKLDMDQTKQILLTQGFQKICCSQHQRFRSKNNCDQIGSIILTIVHSILNTLNELKSLLLWNNLIHLQTIGNKYFHSYSQNITHQICYIFLPIKYQKNNTADLNFIKEIIRILHTYFYFLHCLYQIDTIKIYTLLLQQHQQTDRNMISQQSDIQKQNTQLYNCQRQIQTELKDQALYKNQNAEDSKINIIQIVQDEGLDQQLLKKKTENKQKYRRLKQKLATMCYEHQNQCFIKETKEVSSPNKSRLLTLSIEFEKMTLNQTKDYGGLEAKLKEILKIIDHKREHDLLILKHSRFVPAISSLLKKVPAFHKNQFTQSIKTIELGLKLLRIFCTLSSNRDYMISTNQLVVLNSCLSSFYGKDQKKLALECITVLHQLLSSHIKADSQQIVGATLQIVFFGQLGRKIRLGLQSCISEDNTLIQEQFVLKSLKYWYLLYKKCFQRSLDKPIYQQPAMTQLMQQNSDAILSFLQIFLPSLLLEKDGQKKDQELPICIINISLYILKLLTINTHVNLKTSQKIFDLAQKSQFTIALKLLFEYSKKSIQEGQQIHEVTCICSQIILFLGKINCNNLEIKNNLRICGLLDCLCNHPLIYLMDQNLKSFLIPSLCSVMDGSQQNMIKYLSESSSENVRNYIMTQSKIQQQLKLMKLSQDQEQQPYSDIDSILQESTEIIQKQQSNLNTNNNNNKSLTRKSSESSLNSYTTQCTQNSYSGSHAQNQSERFSYKLLNLVPFQKWDKLMEQLVKLDN